LENTHKIKLTFDIKLMHERKLSNIYHQPQCEGFSVYVYVYHFAVNFVSIDAGN